MKRIERAKASKKKQIVFEMKEEAPPFNSLLHEHPSKKISHVNAKTAEPSKYGLINIFRNEVMDTDDTCAILSPETFNHEL